MHSRPSRKYRSVLLCKSSAACLVLKLFELICFSMFHRPCQQQAAAAAGCCDAGSSLRGNFQSSFTSPPPHKPQENLHCLFSFFVNSNFVARRKSFFPAGAKSGFSSGEKSCFGVFDSTCWPCGALRLTVETLVSRSDPRLHTTAALPSQSHTTASLREVSR